LEETDLDTFILLPDAPLCPSLPFGNSTEEESAASSSASASASASSSASLSPPEASACSESGTGSGGVDPNPEISPRDGGDQGPDQARLAHRLAMFAKEMPEYESPYGVYHNHIMGLWILIFVAFDATAGALFSPDLKANPNPNPNPDRCSLLRGS